MLLLARRRGALLARLQSLWCMCRARPQRLLRPSQRVRLVTLLGLEPLAVSDRVLPRCAVGLCGKCTHIPQRRRGFLVFVTEP